LRGRSGASGMGEVYRSKDMRLGRDVAIKVLPESLVRDSERLQRFEQEAQAMIAQALKHDGPALVEVIASRRELSMPPTITLEQMKGFSLFMLRAVLGGRGDEIVDRAKINIFC
jgi:serine/threonine protein kinase